MNRPAAAVHTIDTLVNHPVRLAARPVGLSRHSDWQLIIESVGRPAAGALLIQRGGRAEELPVAAGQTRAQGRPRFFDCADRYSQAIAEMAGRLKDGRMKRKEDAVEGGVAAFPATLNKLFLGETFSKLVLNRPIDQAPLAAQRQPGPPARHAGRVKTSSA